MLTAGAPGTIYWLVIGDIIVRFIFSAVVLFAIALVMNVAIVTFLAPPFWVNTLLPILQKAG